jgi:hypothetical protein
MKNNNPQEEDEDLIKCLELSQFSSIRFDMKNHPYFDKYRDLMDHKLNEDLDKK